MTENAPKQILNPKKLSNEECRQLLMQMDREAKDFWKEQRGDLVGALEDDLRSFGTYETQEFIFKASLT